jgi:eukaryotic-like serine/threonine-protein kinase
MVRRTSSIARVLAAVTAVGHAAAFAPGAQSRVVVPADGGARGSGQRQQRQRAHGGSGAARAGGRADAAPATRSASAPEAQRWAFVTGSSVRSSPAVSPDGASIFVGSRDYKVYALNAATGAQRWAFSTGGYVYSLPAVSPDGASIFVGSSDNKVYALNAATGAQRWAFATGGDVESSPAVSPDGASIFVGSWDNKVYALNAATGAQRWAFETGGVVFSSPAVSPDGTSVFVGSGDNKVYALNAATGAQRWAFTTGGDVFSSPAVSPDGASIFVGSDDNKVYALNAATGAQRWAFATGGYVRSSPAVRRDGTSIFVGSYDYKVYALNAATGAQRWAFTTGGDVYSSPAVSPDGATIFVGSWDYKVYALNAATGAQRWAFETGGAVESSPAVSPDGARVYVGSYDNKVYALNAATEAHLPTESDGVPPSGSAPPHLTCVAGEYSPYKYSVICIACEAGTYSSSSGASTCSPCPTGSFASSSSSRSCTPCASGKYTTSPGASACTSPTEGATWGNPVAQRWTFSTGGYVYSSPAVSPDGATIFVGSLDNKVYALNAATGAQRWAFETGGVVRSSPAVSRDGASVFVGSNDNKVYALNASTGAQRWAFATGGYVFSSPAVSPDGTSVFVGSYDYKVYALNASTGAQWWAFTTGGYVYSSPAVSPDGASIFVGSYDYKVYALNAATGAQRWAFATGGYVRSSPAVSRDGASIFVGSGDNKVYALNAATGAQRWAFETGSNVESSPAVRRDGASIFVGSWDNKVYALNAATGAQRWAFTTGGDVVSSPAVSPDGASVFVGSGDNKVYALNAATGAQRWAFSTGGDVVSSPAVSPDGASIFVGSNDNKVYALNAATEAHMAPSRGVSNEQMDSDNDDSRYASVVLPIVFGIICGVVSCLALAAGYSKSATVRYPWLVTWVVYSIVSFVLIGLAELINTSYFSGILQIAGFNNLFHVFVMAVLILGRIQGNNNNEQTRQVPQASLHASAQTVVFSAQLTCCEEIFFATIGRIIQLVDLFIWILSMIGIDLSPFFFPMPFFKFYHARLFTSHYRIQGARIYLNAGFSDAYFLYLQERMLNSLTFTVYTRCKGETYPKWLDSKLQWIGTPPHGYNNHFRIFFNTGTLCERIDYYVQSTILFTFFGWLPFFRPIYLWWHYKQMVQRLVIGGSKATLDDGYSLCSFFGAYLGSCCGCCGHKILVFVDSHLHLRPAGIVAMEGEREMGALFGLTNRPQNSGMGSQSDQVPPETKDIQIQRSMQPGPDGMAGIGMRFVCVAGSLEPVKVAELTPGQPADLSGQIYRNQQIVKINGQDVRGLEMNQVVGLIQGAPGTMVMLTVIKPSTHLTDRPPNSGMGSQSHVIATANQSTALQETQDVQEQSHTLPAGWQVYRAGEGKVPLNEFERAVTYLEQQKDMPKGAKEVRNWAGVGKVPVNEFERAVAYLEIQKDIPKGAKEVGNRAGVGKVPLNEFERAAAYLEAQKTGTSCNISPSRGMFSAMKSGEILDDTKLFHNSTCGAAGAGLAAGSVALPPAPSLNISSPPGQRFIKVPVDRPPPMHMKTRDTQRQVLLGLYFERLSDTDWMNEVLAEYDLSDDKDDLISNGIKKGSDLGILMHEPSLLRDLSMTVIARAKLRILLKDLSEICNAHPEEDATLAATLDDVELRYGSNA